MNLSLDYGIPIRDWIESTMPKPAKDCFGEALLFLIRRKGISQKDLANALGVRPSTVSGWVRKKEIPRETALDKLANYFNCHVAMLFLPPDLLEKGSGKFTLDFSEVSDVPVYLVRKRQGPT